MSTAEMKKKLIEKIKLIADDELLLEATKLLEIQLSEIETPYILTKDMNNSIDIALEQVKNGEVLSEDEANKEIDEWLEK